MAASAEPRILATGSLPAPLPSSVMWLPASALNCYEGDAIHRDWLLTPGLLTQRIRAAAADRFSMHLLNECRYGDEFVREIDMCSDNTVWLFAHTRIPADTAKRHEWLTRIGERTLGEAIADQTALERAPFRFAQAYPDTWLAARALEHARLAPRPLWVRHSAFRIEAAPFDLYEVFMPTIGSR